MPPSPKRSLERACQHCHHVVGMTGRREEHKKDTGAGILETPIKSHECQYLHHTFAELFQVPNRSVQFKARVSRPKKREGIGGSHVFLLFHSYYAITPPPPSPLPSPEHLSHPPCPPLSHVERPHYKQEYEDAEAYVGRLRVLANLRRHRCLKNSNSNNKR